mmetsp:Transcript_11476/g.23535  ORF Transcript_11476/g.23535 Transcript_11476/m.23535 type:complete len:99 (-) Transcript_11476:1735-2031(-)
MRYSLLWDLKNHVTVARLNLFRKQKDFSSVDLTILVSASREVTLTRDLFPFARRFDSIPERRGSGDSPTLDPNCALRQLFHQLLRRHFEMFSHRLVSM